MSALEYDNFDEPPPPRDTSSRRPAISARVPPNDLDAEASLLGAMLLSRE